MYSSKLILIALVFCITACSKKEVVIPKATANVDSIIATCRANMKANDIPDKKALVYCTCITEKSIQKFTLDQIAEQMNTKKYDDLFVKELKDDDKYCRSEAN